MRPFLVLTLTVLAGLPSLAKERAPSPPEQPATGPGGADYPHVSLRRSEHGKDGEQYWLYEPALPSPAKAPLIIFLHGYSAMSPEPYEAWLEHLTRKGAIVVYPRYQASLVTLATQYHANVATAVRDALTVLAQPGHVAPDLNRVAVVGHSAGGVGAATYAALAKEEKLPIPLAVMCVCPGQGPSERLTLIPLDDYSKIAATTRLLVLAGDEDKFVGDISSRRIWTRTAQVKDRALITVQSDTHGRPGLHANHFSPLATGHWSTDALDWYGYWRLFDTLSAEAFAGKKFTLDPAMGKWSDGTAIAPLKVER